MQYQTIDNVIDKFLIPYHFIETHGNIIMLYALMTCFLLICLFFSFLLTKTFIKNFKKTIPTFNIINILGILILLGLSYIFLSMIIVITMSQPFS